MLGLSTSHQIGLGVAAAAFIVFALASSFLFPRFRPQFPGCGLAAFVVVSFVFFFAMLTAVEVFGAEEKEGGEREAVVETTTPESPSPEPTPTSPTTSTRQTTTQKTTTVVEVHSAPIQVSETEFKIALQGGTEISTGEQTFHVVNDGKIDHDLAIKGLKEKTKIIPAGGSADLTVDLKPGKYVFYCTVPGHEAAGMKLNVTVS